MTPSATAGPVLVTVALLAACVWIGGFVAIAVVARVARSVLDPPARVAFFRSLGRSYGVVGGTALVVCLASGALLLRGQPWTATTSAAAGVAGAVVVATVAGVIQARAMTRLRRRALADPGDPVLAASIRRRARSAAALRAAIGTLSIALVALAAVLAT
jgi:uncharacterized membrane protein